MPDIVQEDIDQSKKQESVNVQMTDGKVVCNFSMMKDSESREWPEWISYPKVFDDWESFVEYAKEFFKSNTK